MLDFCGTGCQAFALGRRADGTARQHWIRFACAVAVVTVTIGLSARSAAAEPVCVTKTLSTLMRWQNHLSWRNDWVAVFIPCSRDRAMQVEEPT